MKTEAELAATPKDVVGYWRHAGPSKWYAKSAAFDEALRLRFEPVHHAAARGEYDHWIADAEGALALLILLDQIPRNLYRGSAHAFATDPKARSIARAAVASGYDGDIEEGLVQFLYMPLVHSEDPADQASALHLFAARPPGPNGEDPAKWAKIHKDIIDRFGRFPHRNGCLGRITTADEQQFLDDGGFDG